MAVTGVVSRMFAVAILALSSRRRKKRPLNLQAAHRATFLIFLRCETTLWTLAAIAQPLRVPEAREPSVRPPGLLQTLPRPGQTRTEVPEPTGLLAKREEREKKRRKKEKKGEKKERRRKIETVRKVLWTCARACACE
jgi:hypothetical protein